MKIATRAGIGIGFVSSIFFSLIGLWGVIEIGPDTLKVLFRGGSAGILAIFVVPMFLGCVFFLVLGIAGIRTSYRAAMDLDEQEARERAETESKE